jgi:peptidoglycan/xylan/chitin deacetylase (PgdA/CDA1 family)
MRFISPLLKKVVYPTLQLTGGLRRLAPTTGVAVVNYHGVLPADYRSRDAFLDDNLVSQGTLQKQLRFLKAHYSVIRPDEFREWLLTGRALPPRSVLLTCDDGLLNNLTDMLPTLQQEGMFCLFFVTGASCSENAGMLWYEELYHLLRMGNVAPADLERIIPAARNGSSADSFQSTWWTAVCTASSLGNERRTELLNAMRSKGKLAQSEFAERRWRLLNADELRKLSEAGMTIGAHTITHPVLSQCSDEESYHEIQGGKAQLESVLGQAVWAFAYPFGNTATTGDREVRLSQQAGFECAFLNMGGGFSDRARPLQLPRTHITAGTSIAELEAHMTGLHSNLQSAVRG